MKISSKIIIKDIIICALLSCFFVILKVSLNKAAFLIADVQDYNFPLYKEMGKIWMSGHIPILTTQIMNGQNYLVEMVLTPFLPQIILISIFTYFIHSMLLISMIYVFMNSFLLISGGYWIGRILSINRSLSILIGFLLVGVPMYSYISVAAWWGMVLSFPIFILALASTLNLLTNLSKNSFLFAVFWIGELIATADTHLQICFLFGFILISIFDYLEKKEINRVFVLTNVLFCVFLVVFIPLKGEFIFLHKIIERPSYFSNIGNCAVAEFWQIINFFNPFFHGNMNWFGGQRVYLSSLGYATILSIYPIFFMKLEKKIFIDYKTILKPLLYLLFITVILLFLPTRFGPIRWPFRFLPVFDFIIIVLTIFYIDKAAFVITKERKKYFCLFLIMSSFLQFFSAFGKVFDIFQVFWFCIYIILMLILFIAKDKSPKDFIRFIWYVSVLAWIGFVFNAGSPQQFFAHPTIENLKNVNLPKSKGYTLVLSEYYLTGEEEHDISQMADNQFLFYDIRSVNGISSVGHKGFTDFFLIPGQESAFNRIKSLVNLSAPADNIPGVFNYQLFDIDRIYTFKQDITPEISKRLNAAGLNIQNHVYGRVLITPKKPLVTEADITYQSIPNSLKFIKNDGMTKEWFNVTANDKEMVLIFSRLYWPGYHVFMNGTELPITSYKNVLLEVHIPANMGGVMKLSYIPVSWKYSKWSILIGFFIFLITVIRLSTTKLKMEQVHNEK